MLDIRQIRKRPELIKQALQHRNEDPAVVDRILKIDEDRRMLITEVESLKGQRNIASKQIAQLKAEKREEEARSMIAQGKDLGDKIKLLDAKMKELDEQQSQILSFLPNLPSNQTPLGKDEQSNTHLRSWGQPRNFEFEPKPHWDLGTDLQMLDFERAGKLSGARFVVVRHKLARLERALIQFMLDVHTREHGYIEVSLPHLVKRDTMFVTGQLPKFEEEAYKTAQDDLFLIPTSEVFLAGMHRDEILNETELPLKYVAYSPCYRREAGSYGKDVRGMIRVHQFHKVELVQYTRSDDSFDHLESLTAHAEKILQLLELPYRVVALCTGDLGFGNALTYDLEVWLPSYKAYREISSCSNDTDFQSRRGNIRYRNLENRLEFVHTLNGSGVAVGRAMVAIMENYQRPDGSIEIPKVLQPYMGGEESIF